MTVAGGLLVGLVLVGTPALDGRTMTAQDSSVPATPLSQSAAPARSDDTTAPEASGSSPWLLLPVVSSNPKLGTAFGAFGAYVRRFDSKSRVSLIGATYQYTSTHSEIAALFARTSFGADHHRIAAVAAGGLIRNDYQDYLGSGQPLKTNDDLRAGAVRYLYRAKAAWFGGAQAVAANYQVFGDSTQDDLVLETLGLNGFRSVAIGAVALHDSRDNDDMPVRGWYLNVNNLAYREAFGGLATFDAYRADLRTFWWQGGRHILAIRQNNWFTHDAPSAVQASVVLRGYKVGQYLAPYMSSIEAEERLSLTGRWGATLFAGVAGLYGDRSAAVSSREYYPTWGAGLQFILKPAEHLLANFEYAHGIEDNHGFYLKFGYGW
jgi:hypothetical protein